jgi:hypothetical protein
MRRQAGGGFGGDDEVATEFALALSELSGSLLKCADIVAGCDTLLPDSVRRHARCKAWRAASAMAVGQAAGVTAEASAAVGQSTLLLVTALLDHVQDMHSERARDKEDVESAIACMQKWRAREEIQRGQVKKLQEALVAEVAPVARLEREIESLKARLRLAEAEAKYALREAATRGLRGSLCRSDSLVSCEGLVERALEGPCSPRSRASSGQSANGTAAGAPAPAAPAVAAAAAAGANSSSSAAGAATATTQAAPAEPRSRLGSWASSGGASASPSLAPSLAQSLAPSLAPSFAPSLARSRAASGVSSYVSSSSLELDLYEDAGAPEAAAHEVPHHVRAMAPSHESAPRHEPLRAGAPEWDGDADELDERDVRSAVSERMRRILAGSSASSTSTV